VVPAFVKAASLYPSHPKSHVLLDAAFASSDVVWERGLLRKGLTGLCHNVAGNGYAFLLLYLARSEDDLQLRRALAFGLYAGQWREETRLGNVRVPDRPWSLMEGLAGGLLYWADLAWVLDDVKATGTCGDETKRKIVGFPCFTDV
jgi:hypothetical protein